MKSLLFKLSKSKIGDLIVGIAFGKLSKFLPVDKIMENDKAVAFWHPKPSYNIHILIVPKKAIKKVSVLKEEDLGYIAECYSLINKIVIKLQLEKGGYSITTNGGDRQEVNQIHFHLYSNISRN
ncbi:HIT domain-containing protein [Candidatus Dojkabacteria bacterium]|nr:HIT domain-containing protein [Candidatus Dojkabacteria bacterium]